MDRPRPLECDMPDCVHCQNGNCAKETAVVVQNCRCASYEKRIILPIATVTIEVSDGVVQNVYASPDLPEIGVELIDFDNLRNEPEDVEAHGRQLLSKIEQAHKHIF